MSVAEVVRQLPSTLSRVCFYPDRTSPNELDCMALCVPLSPIPSPDPHSNEFTSPSPTISGVECVINQINQSLLGSFKLNTVDCNVEISFFSI